MIWNLEEASVTCLPWTLCGIACTSPPAGDPTPFIMTPPHCTSRDPSTGRDTTKAGHLCHVMHSESLAHVKTPSPHAVTGNLTCTHHLLRMNAQPILHEAKKCHPPCLMCLPFLSLRPCPALPFNSPPTCPLPLYPWGPTWWQDLGPLHSILTCR